MVTTAKKPLDDDHEHIYSKVVGVDAEGEEITWQACRICGEEKT